MWFQPVAVASEDIVVSFAMFFAKVKLVHVVRRAIDGRRFYH